MEKLEKEHPDFISEEYPGGIALCPEDCGYEEHSPCEAMEGGQFNPVACVACWNRKAAEEAPGNGI